MKNEDHVVLEMCFRCYNRVLLEPILEGLLPNEKEWLEGFLTQFSQYTLYNLLLRQKG